MTNTINLKAIKNCMMAVSKDRFNISGVYIEDREGCRHYVGTNGHILVHAYETVEKGDTLKAPICIVPRGKIGSLKECEYADLTIVNEQTALIDSRINKIVCDIIDVEYPKYQKIIPYDAPKAKEYACFDDKYLKTLHVILKNHYTLRPFMQDPWSSALWEDEIDGVKYEVVLMSMRTFD